MYRKTFEGMNCSVARALDEVGEWWSLLIVRECSLGTTRFDDFQRRLGIARNVLTARLNLVEHSTGKPVEAGLRAGARTLGLRDVRLEPGPGATAKTHDIIKTRNKAILGLD